MADVIITSDSTCDLSKEQIERENIGIFPLSVILGDKQYKDGLDITPETIFEFVEASKILPKTSAGSVEEYEKFFRKFTDAGKEVVHFNISAKASVSHENAKAAAAKIGGGVYVCDSMALSTGQGLLVMKACDLRAEGKSAEQIFKTVQGLKDKIQTSFVVDRMDYLHKGGRCSSIAYIATILLKIHPYIDMKEGELIVKKKYRGSLKRCIDLYVDDLIEEYGEYDDTRCFITHTRCEREIVDAVREKVQKGFRFKEIIETDAGSVITSHCGKGTLGVLFIKK